MEGPEAFKSIFNFKTWWKIGINDMNTHLSLLKKQTRRAQCCCLHVNFRTMCFKITDSFCTSWILKSNNIFFLSQLSFLGDEHNKNNFKVPERSVFLTATFFLPPVFDNSREEPNQEKVWSFQLEEKQCHWNRKHSRSPGEEVNKQ